MILKKISFFEHCMIILDELDEYISRLEAQIEERRKQSMTVQDRKQSLTIGEVNSLNGNNRKSPNNNNRKLLNVEDRKQSLTVEDRRLSQSSVESFTALDGRRISISVTEGIIYVDKMVFALCWDKAMEKPYPLSCVYCLLQYLLHL